MLGISGSKFEIAVHSAPDLAEDSYAHRWVETLESLGAKVRICDFRARAEGFLCKVREMQGA